MPLLQSRIKRKIRPCRLQKTSRVICFVSLGIFMLVTALAIFVFCVRNVAVPRSYENYNTLPPSYRLTVPPISVSPSPFPLPTTNYKLLTITFVHDGDTIYAKNYKPAIRLLGIDAPELAGSYRCGKDANCTETIEECGATEVKEKLMELVLKQEVILVEDETVGATDKYNRALRYVFRCRERSRPFPSPAAGGAMGGSRAAPTENCSDISLELIRAGLVREAGFGNPYENQKQYHEAELEAKTEKRGIWKKCYQ